MASIITPSNLSFKNEPDCAQELNDKSLNQRSLAQNNRRYRFEIVVAPNLIESARTALKGVAIPDWLHGVVARVDLAINPHTYKVSEPTRESVTQTAAGAWADYYGLGLAKISLAGTTGYNPRRSVSPAVSQFALLNQTRQSRSDRLLSLQGKSGVGVPTGLQDFVRLRNGIHRTYATLLSKMNIDFTRRIQEQAQLRFYAWDTEDYYIVLIDDFQLNRTSVKPMMYEYAIQMTAIGYPQAGGPLTDYLSCRSDALGRLPAVLTGIQRNVNAWKANAAAIAGMARSVAVGIQALVVKLDALSQNVEAVISGTASFISMPLTQVTEVVNSLRSGAQALTELVQLPNSFKNEIHNQMVDCACAVQALKTYESLFKRPFGDTFSSAPWQNLNCSSTMGVSPSPVSPAPGVVAAQPSSAVSISGLKPAAASPSSPVTPTPLASYQIRQHQIKEGDTVESVLKRIGGADPDAAEVWQQVVTLNDLEFPYVAPSASFQKEVSARVRVTFFGTPNTVIPAGTRVATDASNPTGSPIVFDTDAEAVVPAEGSVSVWVTAEKPGDFSNVQALTITRVLNSIDQVITIPGITGMENPIAANGGRIYRVLLPGDQLLVPSTIAASTGIVDQTSDNTEDLFGSDISLDDDGDFVPDVTGDLATASGVPNVVQAVGDRLDADQGDYIKHSLYGRPGTLIGEPGDQNAVAMAKIGLEATLRQDPRISGVSNIRAVKTSDELRADCDLVLIDGSKTPLTLTIPT